MQKKLFSLWNEYKAGQKNCSKQLLEACSHLVNRPEARGYVIYSPRTFPEGNNSHNHELQADKRLKKNASIVHLSFVFQHSMLALVGFTSFSAF